jgi:hypothetical protein
MPKQQILSSSSSTTSIGINQNLVLINDDYQRINQNSENNMNILTTTERRERISTLLIIAFIALLTGKIIFLFDFLKKRTSPFRY